MEITVPQLGRVLRFTDDSSALLVGGQRGLVMNYDLEGKLLWQVSLGKFNKALENPPLYDPSFRDLTPTLWPGEHDQPGELDKIVRMGENRLANGDCESQAGWQGGQVAYHNEGHGGASSLRVGGAIVHQEVTKYLGNHVTWVLEFFYKAAPGSQAPELLAGVMVDSKYPYSTARNFTAGEAWRFARVAVKSGVQCRALTIGLRAKGGEVLVDSATLRQIRFPSVNHLHYEPLHDIDPVILTNPLFTEDYDPVGNVRFQAFGQVSVPPYGAGGKPVVEPAFMQNGRINDMSSFWYEMPQMTSWDERTLLMSMALKEPRWISHVAVFFNYYDEKNVTPHFDVFVTNAETRKEILVASIRNNRKVFQLLKFPPIKTATVKFEFINTIKRLRTVTEIELYGPLSGKEGQAGFADSEGQNTYMGDFTRVDKRKKTLAPAYGPPVPKSFGHDDTELLWAVCTSQIVAGDDKFYVSRSLGYNEMYSMDQLAKSKSLVRGKALTFGPHVTLYGGLLLKCGSHGRLYLSLIHI